MLPIRWSFEYVDPPDEIGAAAYAMVPLDGGSWASVVSPLLGGDEVRVSRAAAGDRLCVPALPYKMTGRDPVRAGELLCVLGAAAVSAMASWKATPPETLYLVLGSRYVDLLAPRGEDAYLVYFGAAARWPS